MISVKAVLLDFGCVLTLAPTLHDYEPLRKAIGMEAGRFQEVYWRERDAYDRGTIDNVGFWRKVAQAARVPFSAEQRERWETLDCELWNTPNAAIVDWVRVLRGHGFKTAVLSNMPLAVSSCLRQKAPCFKLFDHLCFSGELGIVKPDAAIYRACLEGVGVAAAQALFIDDREVNVAGARALGINSIRFQSVEQLAQDLKPYGLEDSLATPPRNPPDS